MIKIIKGENLEIKMDVETEYENHRFETFFTKEPETISWIKSLFKPNDIFFDIGANVGIYSLFARSVFGDKIKIFSFEPAYHNFEKLCRNIILNKFKKFFTPYCVAIGETTRFDIMNLASHVSGSASSMLSTAPKYLIENFASEFSQGVFSVTLDDLFENYEFPCPQHIKIDIAPPRNNFFFKTIDIYFNMLRAWKFIIFKQVIKCYAEHALTKFGGKIFN